MHRRVESLAFVDAAVVRRRLSVDFTLPKQFPSPVATKGRPLFFVPLTMLPKRPGPMRFDVQDESGGSLPLLTEREHSRITGAALLEGARRCLPQPQRSELGGELGQALARIAVGDYDSNVADLLALLVPNSPEWRAFRGSAAARRSLLRDNWMKNFIALAAGNNVAVVPVELAPGSRRVLKLAFEETIRPEALGRSRRSFGEVVGWSATLAGLQSPLVGAAESYHVQVSAPLNLELTQAELIAWSPYELVMAQLSGRAAGVPQVHVYTPKNFDTRAHLYVPSAREPTSGRVSVGFRAERKGFLTGAAIAAWGIVAVLTLYWRAADSLVTQSSSANALLLISPGLVAAYLARPGEHALVRKLLVFPRSVLVLAAASVFSAAAAVLAFGGTTISDALTVETTPGTIKQVPAQVVASDNLETALVIALIVGVIAAITLTLSRLLPRPKTFR